MLMDTLSLVVGASLEMTNSIGPYPALDFEPELLTSSVPTLASLTDFTLRHVTFLERSCDVEILCYMKIEKHQTALFHNE